MKKKVVALAGAFIVATQLAAMQNPGDQLKVKTSQSYFQKIMKRRDLIQKKGDIFLNQIREMRKIIQATIQEMKGKEEPFLENYKKLEEVYADLEHQFAKENSFF